MRWPAYLLLTACWSSSSPSTELVRDGRLVIDGVFSLTPNGPVTDLQWKGTDSRVGGYRVGTCTLSYDHGGYQSGLEPAELGHPEQYRYRTRKIGNRPARWATWTVPGEADHHFGVYWLAVYVPGLQISVSCPTAAGRDAAIAMLETLRIDAPRRGDFAKVDPANGPTLWSPAPQLCTIEHDAPVGMTSNGRVRFALGEPSDLITVMVVGPSVHETRSGAPDAVAIDVPPGTYTVDVTGNDGMVRCTYVELAAGRVTTVRVERFRL